MQDAASDLAPPSDGDLDGRDHEPGFRPVIDGPADDPVREDVFDVNNLAKSVGGLWRRAG